MSPPTGGTPRTNSNLTRMASKGLAKKDDFRIIFKSDLILNSPYAYLADLPPDLKAAIAKAFIDVADQGQGRLRQAVRRQGPRVHQGRCQGLRARRRADQVRRLAAQAEELIAAAATLIRELARRPAAGGATQASARGLRRVGAATSRAHAAGARLHRGRDAAGVGVGRGLAGAIHRQDRPLPELHHPAVPARERPAGLDGLRRVVLGPAALAPAPRRDAADGLCRHAARRRRRLRPLLPGRGQCRAERAGALRRAPRPASSAAPCPSSSSR